MAGVSGMGFAEFSIRGSVGHRGVVLKRARDRASRFPTNRGMIVSDAKVGGRGLAASCDPFSYAGV